MAPLAAFIEPMRARLCISGLAGDVLLALKAMLAAELPQLLEADDCRTCIFWADPAASIAALEPAALRSGSRAGPILESLESLLASAAAAEADAVLSSGFQGTMGFWFAQPRDAAALAAAWSFRRPIDGKLGKSWGSAYLSRPECPRRAAALSKADQMQLGGGEAVGGSDVGYEAVYYKKTPKTNSLGGTIECESLLEVEDGWWVVSVSELLAGCILRFDS